MSRTPESGRKRPVGRPRRLLVVDDSAERIEFFRLRLGTRGVFFAMTYAEAVAALRRLRFRRLFLDHDLGGTRNGSDLAYWLTRRLPRTHRPDVIIHSANSAGTLAMLNTLKRAGFAVATQPFPPSCLEVAQRSA